MAAQPEMERKQNPRLEQPGDEEKIRIRIWPLPKPEVVGMGGFFLGKKGLFRSRGAFLLCLGALWWRSSKRQTGFANKTEVSYYFFTGSPSLLLETAVLFRATGASC